MKEQQVTQILQEIAEQGVSDSLDLWPAIRAQVQPQRRPSWWMRVVPTTRLGWASLALVLLLAFAGASWAGSARNRAFRVEPGLRHIEQAGLGQEVNLSQTVDGVTVTLQRVYADANRIIVGYTVSGPTAQKHGFPETILTDDRGNVFPHSTEAAQPEFPPYAEAAQDIYIKTIGCVSSFEADAVQGTPATLSLHLLIDLVSMETATGPFTFDFSVPFDAGRDVEVQQTVEAAGVAMRLERVVVTPSETRAILCFTPPDGNSDRWRASVATLDTGDWQNHDGFAINTDRRIVGEEVCNRYSFLDPLLDDQRGLWTLMVDELYERNPAQPDKLMRLSGPWVFRFRVP